jgi:N-acetylglucosamine repressor
MTSTQLGNRDLIRAINRSIILNTIKLEGTIDRAEIARRTHLSPATITAITAELIEQDLIFEKQIGDSRGGRPPILLAINPSGGYVIGTKVTEDRVSAALIDLEASVLLRKSVPLPAQTAEAVVKAISGLVDKMLAEYSLPRHKLLGVGVGVAGMVDFEHGILRQSPYFGWQNLPLRELLQKQFRTPIIIDNDVNTLTIAEKWYGAGQDVENFLVVTIGRGVGMGIVANGQFYRGARGGAGEFGHILVDPDGAPCGCGKRGCLETIVGEPGLVRQAIETQLIVDSVDAMVVLANAGNPTAQMIFENAGKILGRALGNLINIFSPEKIIIAGEGTRLGEWIFTPMKAEIQCSALPSLFQDVEICIDTWGDDAWARGAASLVLHRLFESPVRNDER